MNDIWVCDQCKSINRQRDDVCYACRAPQTRAMDAPGLDLRREKATLERSVRQYLPAWPLAGLAGVLITMVAVLGLVILRGTVAEYPAMKQAFADAMTTGSRNPDSTLVVQSVELGLLSLARFGLTLAALMAFAGWLGLATRNVPLLGGGDTSRGPLRVFVYTLIPIWNLFKVPGMIQDVMYRVDPRSGGALMVLAAWIGLVGSWLVSVIGSWAITAAGVRSLMPAIAAGDMAEMIRVFGSVLDQSMILGVVVEVMIAAGAILLVVIMFRIEARCASRDREIKASMAASGAPVPAAGPEWGAAPTAATGDVVPSPAAAASTPGALAAPDSPATAPSAGPQGAGEPAWPASRPWPGASASRAASTDDMPLAAASTTDGDLAPASPPPPPVPVQPSADPEPRLPPPPPPVPPSPDAARRDGAGR